jgi:sarcosine oxidase subunit beta
MPSRCVRETEIVVVGGGVIGCSIAYHLAQAGKRDVLLVERNDLGSGTTSSSADHGRDAFHDCRRRR